MDAVLLYSWTFQDQAQDQCQNVERYLFLIILLSVCLDFQEQASLLHSIITFIYLTVACDHAGGSGAVNTFCVSRKMREQSSAPPEENGQLFVAAVVIVARTSV